MTGAELKAAWPHGTVTRVIVGRLDWFELQLEVMGHQAYAEPRDGLMMVAGAPVCIEGERGLRFEVMGQQ